MMVESQAKARIALARLDSKRLGDCQTRFQKTHCVALDDPLNCHASEDSAAAPA
jgi:hypothetical protein